ncbi:MAG: hypothetical protein QOE77_2998 [Blastocatellia bacterium]|jgi:uncharacterized repeat protein (TIGR01451 family)|nr:hypothetical protein [Blastocatellia bacterium]
MSTLLKRTSRVFLAVTGLLLVGGAVALAQHNNALVRILTGPVHAVVAAVQPKPAQQQLANNRPLVKLFLTGAIQRDSKSIPIEQAGPVTPGEVVSFTMNSVNEGGAPAREYRAIGQIPSGATFVAGSALAERDTQVSYSIDNGQMFSATPMIEEKQADGTIKRVAAPVSMYTQVRFEWADPLAAGGKLVTSYQVRVK